MAKDDQTKNKAEAGKEKAKAGGRQLVEKFRGLPRNAQIALIIGGVVLLLILFSGGEDPAPSQQGGEGTLTTRQAVETQQEEPSEVFSGLDLDEPGLMRQWFEQNQRDLANMREDLNEKIEGQEEDIERALQRNSQLQQEMQQVLQDFRSEIQSMRQQDQRDREVLNQIADETRRLQLDAPAQGQVEQLPANRPRERINQTPLGSPGLAGANNQALLSPVVDTLEGGRRPQNAQRVNNNQPPPSPEQEEEERLPFVPPLGFIKATLINGVDALVGGTPTPALARVHGQYKTAMNSRVNLDGCFMLIEFNGEISTERAIGKPSRMTCVYPDRGTVTYSLSGYVVDAQDGIIGVPGVFYEGDATRLAAAMAADFAAGVAQIIESNQNTFTVSDEGTAQKTVTGDELKAELAGGVDSAVSSLRDYLFERANRVVPFIRLDATRTLHVVLLSGVELRDEGEPWSRLFAAD